MADHIGPDTSISLSPEDENNAGQQVDAAALAVGKFFGATALPLGLSFAKAAAIEMDANFARQLDGADNFVLGAGGGMPLDDKSRAEREDEATQVSIAYIAALFGDDERRRAREIEHERQWLAETHTYAGQTLSGPEWKTMMDWFRDDANSKNWEDAMMAETGQTRADIRATGGKMKRFYDLMDKDAKGAMTTTERDEFDALQRDRDVRRGLEVQQEILSLRHSQTADLSHRNDATIDGTEADRATSFAAVLNDETRLESGLAAVQPLSPTYQNAALGTVPFPSPTARPAPLPAQTIQVNPDNMFG